MAGSNSHRKDYIRHFGFATQENQTVEIAHIFKVCYTPTTYLHLIFRRMGYIYTRSTYPVINLLTFDI